MVLGAYTAAIIAIILAIVEIVEIWGGWSTGITKEWIMSILAVLAPIFAWWAGHETS
jgi:hypothetical protein